MTPDVSGLFGAAGAAASGFGRTGEAPETSLLGEWNGISVSSAATPESLLADAAEELTFSASEEVEKDVAEHRKVEKKEPREFLKVEMPPEVREKMEERIRSRMKELREALGASGGNPALFGQALDKLFPDPSERHAALLSLKGELEGQPSLAVMVDRAIEALEAGMAREIQAGYNIAGVDPGPLDRGEAAEMYRKTVLGDGDVGAVLGMVLERCRGGDFVGTVDFLARSVGADLSASTPSSDRRDLEAMNNDLFNLRALGNFTREFDAAIGGLRERHGLPALADVGRDILTLLLKNKDARLVSLDGLKSILDLRRERGPTYDVQALTRTHGLTHEMPIRLFADGDSRQRLLDGVQKLIDAAVDLEESLMEEGE